MDIKKEFLTSIKLFIGFSVLLGLIYPLIITGIAQLTMPYKANGSLIQKDGKVIGSDRIGQNFDSPKYFHSRPSAVNYNGTYSGASNLGPTSKKLIEITQKNIDKVRKENNIKNSDKISADMVLSSASGLDPDISIKNAHLQIPRIAKERNIPEAKLKEIVKKNIDSDFLGIWGHQSVNVLKLNIELDKISGK